MNEPKISYEALLSKYNSAMKREMAMKRKISSLQRENDFLNKCLVFLTMGITALAILILR